MSFDHTQYGKQERGKACVDQSYVTRKGPLAPFIADPSAAKASGALPLAPPSRPRIEP